MDLSNKVVVTCAITGVLTNPEKFNVPVTPAEMAEATRQAFDQGASIVHAHFRSQQPGMEMWPTWDVKDVGNILGAMRQRVPRMIINMSTGVMGANISGPIACLEKFKPEMAATPATLKEQAREHILQALKMANGNRTQAAKLLGIDRVSLWRKLKKLGIESE